MILPGVVLGAHPEVVDGVLPALVSFQGRFELIYIGDKYPSTKALFIMHVCCVIAGALVSLVNFLHGCRDTDEGAIKRDIRAWD